MSSVVNWNLKVSLTQVLGFTLSVCVFPQNKGLYLCPLNTSFSMLYSEHPNDWSAFHFFFNFYLFFKIFDHVACGILVP